MWLYCIVHDNWLAVGVLRPGNIWGQIRTGTDLWQFTWLYSAAPLGDQASQHQNLITHSVTLSWHWANQSLLYSNNIERQARVVTSINFISHYFDSAGFFVLCWMRGSTWKAGNGMKLRRKSVHLWRFRSSYWSYSVDPFTVWAIFCSNQRSTTGPSKDRVCAVLSVGKHI